MCGICGIATRGEAPDAALVRRMCRSIVHRGPDGEGLLTRPGVALGMRRLAVIDLVTGQQPMGNETGSVQVVFNGEIYNFRELRDELEAKGHRFETRSDTEVIPHLYEEHGLEFPRRLNGMFAIALWDDSARRLVLARDRVGIKPLFWSVRDGTLYFGSEVKCILAAGGSTREVDLAGLDQLLTFEYTASPTTLLRDVRKLAPGGWLVWERGEMTLGRFWTLADSAQPRSGDGQRSESDWAEDLRATLDAAVSRQMVSDVPLGAFLSGGIDSSILVSAMRRASVRPVKTFSIGFRNRSYDELPFARLVASHCETEHHEEVLEPSYLDLVSDVIEHMDQPIGDFSVFPTLLVSRVARRHVTVTLSGDGGDELFAGYDAYLADRIAAATTDRLPVWLRRTIFALGARLPETQAKKDLRSSLKRFLEGAALPAAWQHLRWMTFLSPEPRCALYRPEVLAEVGDGAARAALAHLENGGADRSQRQRFCDTTFYLPENILAKVDLMGMAPSLETRVPYLDNEVIDLALRIPSRLLWRRGERKWLLRRAYARDLPPVILRRGKQGFSMPMKTWLAREWNPLMHELLAESELHATGLFEPPAVTRLVREHEEGRTNHSHLLWSLMVFQLWRRRFLLPERWLSRGEVA
ncbi:MAG: asparagine synthase (glutamine-hydrolyzing) [Deltaproteobacteria bacterium]|nr:asparagine synthase (glutamine-hydrolyzing) [Deltaproteobacteria bacterium]